MNRDFKAHPLFIFKFMKPFLFVLLLPVTKGIIQYIISRKATGILPLEILFAVLILLFAFAEFKAFSVSAEKERLFIKSGFIVRRFAEIKITKIASAVFEKSPFDAVFGAVTCKINTESGRIGKADFIFKLKEKDADRLAFLLYGEKGGVKIAFSSAKIAIVSAATSSAIGGIIFAVPLINRLGRLLGVAINEMLISRLNRASGSLNTWFPPIVNAVTFLFFVSYALSFILSLISYARLNIRLFDNKIIASSGFIVRRCAYIKRTAINGILTEQSPVMRFFGRYCISVSVAGYTSRRKGTVLIPSVSSKESENIFLTVFGEFAEKQPFIRPKRQKTTLWRFYFMPRVYGIIIISLSAAAMLFFQAFARVVLFTSAVLMLAVLYYAYVCRLDYENSKISFGDTVCAESSYKLNLRRLNCKKDKVGEIRLTQTPADRLYRTCKVRITLRSQDAESIRIKHINYDATVEKICKIYGINL